MQSENPIIMHRGLPVALPLDKVPSKEFEYRVARQEILLNSELADKLEELGTEHDTEVLFIILAVYEILLYRCGGQTRFRVSLIGPVTSLMDCAKTDSDCAIDHIPSHVADMSGNPTFLDFMRKITSGLVGPELTGRAMDNMVSVADDSHDLAALQAAFGTCSSLDSRHSGESHMTNDRQPFIPWGLCLWVETAGHSIRLYLEYNSNLFCAATIQRMVGHFEVLLRGVMTEPETTIQSLPLLTDLERQQLLVAWNDTGTPNPTDKCVHQLFEEQAEKTPTAVAVEYEEEEMTYQELNERANQLARLLRTRGVAKETLVGICLERSMEMIVSILGVLKAGGACVPVDPAYPVSRISYILGDAEPKVVLVSKHTRTAIPSTDAQVIALDNDVDALTRESRLNPDFAVNSSNLAYVIYTSGSTGQPKGVLVEHRNLANHNLAMVHNYSIVATDRVLQFSSISFDVAFEEIGPTLISGATLVLAKRERITDLNEFTHLINEAAITVVNLPVSYWTAWTQTLDFGGVVFPHRLRLVITGSEQVPAKPCRQWERVAAGRADWVNAYGPTEATISATINLCKGSYGVADRGERIGRPIQNVRTYVLDSQFQPVPVGVVGELYVAGDGVARGYLNRPEITSERFLLDPFHADMGERMYRTGDLARWKPDGTLECLGRSDNQVKIRGFRIELGEVDSAIACIPGVREVVTMAREDEPGNRRLVSYVVSDGEANATAMRKSLQEQLPPYMVPSSFVFLETLPVTANGKVDRKALAALKVDDTSDRGDYVAPRNEAEERMTDIWKSLLRVAQVSVEEDFFELGGHSLLAIQLVSRIQQVFGKTVPVRTVFRASTIAALVQEMAHLEDGETGVEPISVVDRNGPLPLSYAQEQLWLIDQMEPGTALYNVPMVWRLCGTLHVKALEATVEAVVTRHESLRTVFAIGTDGKPVQVVRPFTFRGLSLKRCVNETEAKMTIAEEIHRPFDLGVGPLWRARLLQVEENEHLLVFTVHHVVSDGWSMGVLAKELRTLYGAFVRGEGNPLEPLHIQYVDYAVWEREWLTRGVLEQQLGYWQEKLGGELPVLQMPTDRPRPAQQTYHGSSHGFTVSKSLLHRLKALSQQEGTTLFMTLLAAYQVLLMRYTGQEDVLVGGPTAGRAHPEAERLIGYFVNTLVYRTDLSGNPSFRALLHRVKDVTIGAYEHRHVPFETLVKQLQLKRDPSYAPLVQTMFVLQNGTGEALSLPGLVVEEEPVSLDVAKFDLTLEMTERETGLEGYLEYNTDLFDRTTIERMIGHFEGLLQGVTEAPDREIQALPLLTEAERAQILEEWNDTAADYSRDTTIPELFVQQAERTADAVAVESNEGHLTYRELNERANRLARYLQKQGVGPETLVGICVEGSLEMVVGILGILKAGGAYVPMDPAYPKERLAYMLEDSNTPVVLTQQRLVGDLPDTTARVIPLDEGWAEIAQESSENLVSGLRANNLAYVIYTSGSTGKPKGVLVEHSSAVNLAIGQIQCFQLGREAKVVQLASFSFDVSVWEILLALLSGATLCVGTREELMPGPSLIEYIRKHQVTMAAFTPPALAVMDPGTAGLDSLRTIVVGGDACPAELAEAWGREREFFDAYGPTEATVCATMSKWGGSGTPRIGKPIANCRVYVLQSNLQPVPIGVPGELYVGGEGVTRGYLNRPALTAERFIPDPFHMNPNARMYKTGDLVKWNVDGELEYIGRTDNQVKIRGYRIELGEVENAVQQLPGVREAAVVIREDEALGKRMMAYVAMEEGVGDDATILRHRLRERLPSYMIPSVITILETLPVTANGKVDRKALQQLESDMDNSLPNNGEGAPRSIMELSMVQLWREVLNLNRIGIHDNFFELGGHSLKVVGLRQAIQERFEADIPISAFFTKSTPAELAELVENVRGDAPNLLVTLQQGSGQEAPLFLVHEVSGGVLEYLDLCRELGTERTIYALVAPGYETDEEPLACVHALASQYVMEVKHIMPQGPYHLLGWSFGGLIAFEMTRFLENNGDQVHFLGLLDAYPYGSEVTIRQSGINHVVQIAERLGVDAEKLQESTLEGATESLVAHVTSSGILPEGIGQKVIHRLLRIMEAHSQAIDEYVPSGLVKADITLFEAKDTHIKIPDSEWSNRSNGHLRVIPVPGDHLSMVRPPHVIELAKAIRLALNDVKLSLSEVSNE